MPSNEEAPHLERFSNFFCCFHEGLTKSVAASARPLLLIGGDTTLFVLNQGYAAPTAAFPFVVLSEGFNLGYAATTSCLSLADGIAIADRPPIWLSLDKPDWRLIEMLGGQ